MSLEDAVLENTAAVRALTAVMGGKTPATPTAETGKKSPGRPRTVKLADVKAMAEKVKEEKGRPAAVALIKEHGADALAELDESKYAAFVAAAEVVLSDTGDDGAGESNAEL